jgi:hypothetical protein
MMRGVVADGEKRDEGRKVERVCERRGEETMVIPFRREGWVKVEGNEEWFSADGEVFMDRGYWYWHEAGVKLEVIEEERDELDLEEEAIVGVDCGVMVDEKVEEKAEVGCEDDGVKRGGRDIGYGGTGGWSVRRSVRLQEMKERDVMKVEVGEEWANVRVHGVAVLGCSCGCVGETDVATDDVLGDVCGVAEVAEDVEAGGMDDRDAEVDAVGEVNGACEIGVVRRVRMWRHTDYAVLFEVYQESIVEGMKGWQERMLDGWMRRGMWLEEKRVLIEKLRAARSRLAKVEQEVIKRRVKQSVGNGDVVIPSGELEPEIVVREQEKLVEQGRDGIGRPEVKVVVERMDVWKDGEEVKQLDDVMRGVLARLREIYAQEEVVKVPSLKSRQRVDVNREVKLVNGLMHNVVVNTIGQVNKLLYAGSFVVAERLGLMRKRGKDRRRRNRGGREELRGIL